MVGRCAHPCRLEETALAAKVQPHDAPVPSWPANNCLVELFSLPCRLEEAELAAKVQSRRAAKADQELDVVKRQLEATERRAKELSWQIRMFADPQQASSGVQSNTPGRFWDVFGCAQPRKDTTGADSK